MQKVHEFLGKPENADLVATIHDIWKHEMFVYGGEDFTRFMKFLSELNNSMNGLDAALKNLKASMGGGNSGAEQAKNVLKAIENSANLTFPDLVIGFRMEKADAAKSQVKRLEEHLQQHMSRQPMLKDRIKSFSADGATGFTVELDGSLVPWAKVVKELEKLDIEKDEVKAALEKLKALKFALAVVVKGDYILISTGGNTQQLSKFGAGTALATREEFAPIKKAGQNRLTSVSYASLKLMSSVTTTPEDVRHIFKELNEALGESPLSEGLKSKIGKDLDEMGKEAAAAVPSPGAYMGFEFLTSRGTEGYSYFFGPGSKDTKPLTVIDQVGGNPLVMIAGRCGDIAAHYKNTVKWLTVFYGHAMEAAEELAPGQAGMVKGPIETAMPFLKKFDELTGTMLFPAVSNGEAAFVLDAKWKSSKWMPMLDQNNSSLPLPEVGLVHSVNDSNMFINALKGYRNLVNEILAMARDFAHQSMKTACPPPRRRSCHPARCISGLCLTKVRTSRFNRTSRVSEKFVVATLSEGHSERLLKSTPLAADLKRLAGDHAIQSAATVDFQGIVASARLWILKMALPAALAEMRDGDGAPPGLRKADIPPQVGTILDVMSSLKHFAAVTYRDGNATVTHYETVLEDVK